MKTGKYVTFIGAIILLTPSFSSTAYAISFKAKYYKECYSGIHDAADLVAPKKSLQDQTKKASGFLSSVGSLAGLGGFGGKAVQAVNAAQKIQKYSGIIENVTAFSTHMSQEHPEPDDRFSAYSSHMSTDATNLLKVLAAVRESQTCYGGAYDQLRADIASGDIKKRKAKKRLKEIQEGTQATGDVLINALAHMDKNLNSYNQALGGEEQNLSRGFGGMAAQFLAGKTGGFASSTPAAGYGNANVNAYATQAYVQAVSQNKSTALSNPVANFTVLNGLASVTSFPSGDGTAEVQPGVQAVAQSSREYLELYGNFSKTADSQRQLEIRVNKKL